LPKLHLATLLLATAPVKSPTWAWSSTDLTRMAENNGLISVVTTIPKFDIAGPAYGSTVSSMVQLRDDWALDDTHMNATENSATGALLQACIETILPVLA